MILPESPTFFPHAPAGPRPLLLPELRVVPRRLFPALRSNSGWRCAAPPPPLATASNPNANS